MNENENEIKNDFIYIIESDGFVRHNYLNHATVNDLIICYHLNTKEIRVIKPTSVTEPQIEISCKIFKEFCHLFTDWDYITKSFVFVVIADSHRFAVKMDYNSSLNPTQIQLINSAFHDYLINSNNSEFSIIGIDHDGHKTKFDNHQDAYKIMKENSYDLDCTIDYSRSYYGSLIDVTDYFENTSIALLSALTGYPFAPSVSEPHQIHCIDEDDVYTIRFLKKSCVSFFVYSTDKYLKSNPSDNNIITADGDIDDLGIYFKIFSTGKHFAIKSMTEKKWLSCIDGTLHVSCDQESPDIFSLFDICLVKFDEPGEARFTDKIKGFNHDVDLIFRTPLKEQMDYKFVMNLPEKSPLNS